MCHYFNYVISHAYHQLFIAQNVKKFIQNCRSTTIDLLVSERTCTEAQKTCKTFRTVDLQL